MLLEIKTKSDVNDVNIKQLKKDLNEKNVVLLIHAFWCGHCQNFVPKWNNLVETYKKKRGIKLISIESEALKELQKVYPAVYNRVIPASKEVYFPMIVFFKKTAPGKLSSKSIYRSDMSENAIMHSFLSK